MKKSYLLFPQPKGICETGEKKTLPIGQCAFSICAQDGGDLLLTAKDKLFSELGKKAMVKEPFVGDYKISLSVDNTQGKEAEGYRITTTTDGAALIGNGEAGALHAVTTFLHLIQNEGNTLSVPIVEIEDSPKFKTRGIYIESRYNDFMTLEDWYGAIDYYSSLKLNTITIGVYGCWGMQFDGVVTRYMYLKLDRHPEIRAPKMLKYYSVKENKWIFDEKLPTIYCEDFFGKLVEYGKKRGIKVIPLINSLGHNSFIPHLYPEISAMDENGKRKGYGMCLSEGKAAELFADIYDETIDKYLAPYGADEIAIGFDELQSARGVNADNIREAVSPFCCCEKCKEKSFSELLSSYTITLLKHLKKRGMKKVYIYFDMLEKYELLNAEFASKLKEEGVYDIAVIDWWHYGINKKHFYHSRPHERFNKEFHSIIKPMAGYENWSHYYDTAVNMKRSVELCEQYGFEGMIAYSSYEHIYDMQYAYLSSIAWNGSDNSDIDSHIKRFFESKLGEDCKAAEKAYRIMSRIYRITDYDDDAFIDMTEFTPYGHVALTSQGDYPRDYLSEELKVISEEREKYIPWLNDVYKSSSEAAAIFNNLKSSSKYAHYHYVNALTYKVTADEYLTLYDLMFDGNKEKKSGLLEINRLIKNRRSLMYEAETVRSPMTHYMTLRIMSIALQSLEDIREHLELVNNDIESIDKNAIVRRTPLFKKIR